MHIFKYTYFYIQEEMGKDRNVNTQRQNVMVSSCCSRSSFQMLLSQKCLLLGLQRWPRGLEYWILFQKTWILLIEPHMVTVIPVPGNQMTSSVLHDQCLNMYTHIRRQNTHIHQLKINKSKKLGLATNSSTLTQEKSCTQSGLAPFSQFPEITAALNKRFSNFTDHVFKNSKKTITF